MSWLRGVLKVLAGALRESSEKPTAGPTAPRPGRTSPTRPSSAESARTASLGGATDVAGRIRETVEDWRGVPYRMGGTGRDGIDCSAFVRRLYAQSFDCELPRTSRDQARCGRLVETPDLRPGDLVFFKISERTRHVGAYLGNGEFGHASTSKGPVISRLASDYWKQRYWTARRVLHE